MPSFASHWERAFAASGGFSRVKRLEISPTNAPASRANSNTKAAILGEFPILLS